MKLSLDTTFRKVRWNTPALGGLLAAVWVCFGAGSAAANVGIAGGAPGCPFPTIADALASSAPGATLLISPGSYLESVGTLTASVSFSAADASCTTQTVGGVTIIPSNGRFATVDGATVEVLGVTLRGGGASEGGLFVVRNSGVLRVHDSELSDSVAEENGGGCIYAEGNSEVRIEGKSLLRNCQAYVGNGGAVHVNNSDLWVLEETVMERNGTRLFDDQGEGGAIFGQQRAQIYVGDKAILRDNDAGGGGAICATHSDVTITDDAEIGPGNTARHGGGIALEDLTSPSAQLRVIGSSRVFENEAEFDGGGIRAFANEPGMGVLVANDVIIEDNEAGELGGGVFMAEASLALVDRVQILRNTAMVGGGVSVLGGFGRIDAEGATFANNTATRDGGGLFLSDGQARLFNTRFIENSAQDAGGGVSVTGTVALFVMDSDFERCTPSTLPADVYCSELRGNTAFEGGGIQVGDTNTRSTTEILHTALVDNTAQWGSAAQVLGKAYLTMTESLVAGNENGMGTGGALEVDGDIALQHVTVTDNLARGLYLDTNGVLAGRASILFNNFGGNHVDGSGYLIDSIRSFQLTGVGTLTETNVSTLSPQFTTTSRGSYRLGSSSPAIDAAPSLASVDLDNVGRPFNGQNDMGCFEMTGARRK